MMDGRNTPSRDMILELAHQVTDDIGHIKGLIHDDDAGKDYVCSDNAYRWYIALAQLVKPKHIVEIGVRFGYSLTSLIYGAIHSGVDSVIVAAIDNECYKPGCIQWWRDYMTRYPNVAINHYHSRPDTLPYLADICSVDGDHTYTGTLLDLCWAWVHTRDGGCIVVDDMNHPAVPGVRQAVEAFCGVVKPEWYELPSFRGTAVIWRNSVRSKGVQDAD